MRLVYRFATFVWLVSFMAPLALAQAGSTTEEPVSAQQKAEITAARTPEELVDLAKGYVLQRAFPAATMAIQKAGHLKPELLVDPGRVSPRSWHEFWFTQRALYVEQKLARNDAATRVKLARWLYDAGLTSQAAQMLTNALAIDKDLPEAKELAEQWNLGSGGPIRIDFTYGVSQPLFVPTIQEENIEILIRRDNVFLVVPVAYNSTDTKLNITKALLKAATDEGRLCPVRGIALLKGETVSTGPQNANVFVLPKLQWPDASQPLWERVQVQEKADKSGYELMCYNQTPPIPKPQIRTPGAPRERVTPQPRPSLPPGGVKETHEAIGYAAFLIEVPQTLKAVDLELRGSPVLKADAAFLQALSVTKDTPPTQRDPAIAILLAATQAKEGPVAAGAAAKLASLRFADTTVTQQNQSALNPALLDKIDQALLTMIAHPDGPARQMAFDVTLRRPGTPPEALLQQIRTFREPTVLLAMLDAIQQLLKQPQPPAEESSPFTAPPQASGDLLGSLPASTAPPGLFAAVTACLANGDAKVRQKAVELLLADGSRESVEALSQATGPARDTVAAQLSSITSHELKAAVVRALLAKADPASAARLLQGAGTMSFVITSDEDPLFTGLTPASSPQALQLLLETLARADLTAVSASERFGKSLGDITTTHQKEPGVRKALLDLALGQIRRLPYEAPLKRERSGTMPKSGTAFEGVLANLAATGTDDKTAQMAAVALLQAGRIWLLGERMAQAEPKRRKLLIDTVGREKDLLEREALPIFLAARLSDADLEVVRSAVAALAFWRERLDPKRRWRFNLGVKQSVELRQLLDVASSSDEKVAGMALDLLASLALLPSREEADFKANTDRSQRDQRLTDLEQQRQAKPSGSYMAMVYVDIKPVDAFPGVVPPTPPASQPEAPLLPRVAMPLAALNATMQTTGTMPRVIVEGSDLTVIPSADPGGNAPSGTPRINAGLLLRGAFTSSEAGQESIAEKVDITPLNEPRECDLKYEQLGTWSCEVSIPESGTLVEGRPLKLVNARIIFEPLPAR